MAFKQYVTGPVFNTAVGLAVVDADNENEITDITGIVLLSNGVVLQAVNHNATTATTFRIRVYSYSVVTGARTEIYDSQPKSLPALTLREFLFPFPSAATGAVYEVVATANDDEFTLFSSWGVTLTAGTLAIVSINAESRFVRAEMTELDPSELGI